MPIEAATALAARATRMFERAICALAYAESETSRKRHARRAVNAQRALSEARRFGQAFGAAA